MYWPVGTPRIYATSASSQAPTFSFVVSHDGLPSPTDPDPTPERPPLRDADSSSIHDGLAPPQPSPLLPPGTPPTPLTPAIKPVEHAFHHPEEPVPHQSPPGASSASLSQLLNEPVLALRVARSGHLFAVITATSMTVWQTKVRPFTARMRCCPPPVCSPSRVC